MTEPVTPQMAKYTFKAERKRKYHRESRMSKAEIMVIMILFHSSGHRTKGQMLHGLVLWIQASPDVQ